MNYTPGKDYYALLNVERKASNIEVAASFRTMAAALPLSPQL